MAADPKKKNNVHLSYMMFFLLILIAVAALFFLLPVFRNYQQRQQELAEVNTKLDQRKTERAELHREVAGLQNSPEEVEKVAREKFGLVKEGETVLRYEDKQQQTK